MMCRLRMAVLVVLSVNCIPYITVLAQTTVSVTVGAQTHQDSLHAAQQRAHNDTVAFRVDSAQKVRDSLRAQRRRAAVVPLTTELLATAFRDRQARDLLTRARMTRLAQDSTLTSYDATTYERLSIGLGLSRLSSERLLLRTERSSRVRWRRGVGAVIDITGVRAAAPALGDGDLNVDDQVPIPYFPGRDVLWVGSGLAHANVSDRVIVNPLVNGAESYYTYAVGDSLVLRLSDQRSVTVQELRVQPRAPRWNVVVGSLWFDVSSGHLVRAIYRLAEPRNVLIPDPTAGDDPREGPSALARAFLPSITAQIAVITVDYGLLEGRFWLPRAQAAEGAAIIGAFRLPVHIQQHFDYASVNGTLDISAIQVNPLDTAVSIAAYRARGTLRQHECDDTSAQRVRTHQWYDGTLPVIIHTPCDSAALASSPTLPPSIYTSTDTLFGMDDRTALINDALSLPRQAAWVPQPAAVRYGLSETRYNRIEGLSTAIDMSKVYGAGYTGHALFRLGAADLSSNGELALARSDGRETVTLGAYRRLTAANDWGDPFSLGASLTALLFGRDDGIYYRTAGAELTHTQTGDLFDTWRLFAERQFDATTRAQFSLPNALGDHSFRGNIDATNGSIVGIVLRRRGVLGEDPARFRALSDLRLEGATGSFDYVRAMMEVALAKPLSTKLSGTLTLSGGASGGQLPIQRLWYIGGPYTVRGQRVNGLAGNAYWFARMEIGSRAVGFKPIVFADLGWAGNRTQWSTNVHPISGAGAGFSALDGLIHCDIAKGLYPANGVKIDAYMDTRF